MSPVSQKGDLIRVSGRPQLNGKIRVPGDKSISHRALMLGAIASGQTKIEGFLPSNDCLSTLNCLKSLGVVFDRSSEAQVIIFGRGKKSLVEPTEVLFAGNSGTTMRMLPGILAGQDFFSVLTGDRSLNERPMARIIRPLTEMGARLFSRENGNKPPIALVGSQLSAIDYEMPVASAQVKSCLLLASLFADGKSRIKEIAPSRDHTERMLAFLGADISTQQKSIEISGRKELAGSLIDVPGDLSSAAFLLSATLISKDSSITVESVGTNPTRTAFLEAVKMMGGRLAIEGETIISNEPRANLAVSSSKLEAIEIGGEMIPNMVDELVIFAVLATQARGKTRVSDARELRVKESDRIAAITSELKKLGADIEEFPDGFVINGPSKLVGTEVDSYGDHRIAMALTIAGLVAEGETVVKGAEAVNVSFPGFIDSLSSLLGGPA